MSEIDHKAQAQSRVYAEYRNKPKALEWMGINGTLGNQIEQAYCDVADSYNIDTAGTDELDVLGRVVVISRSFEGSVDFLTDQFGSSQFGSSQFKPLRGVTDQALNNDIYRLLIKAKIAKNNSDATLDGIILAMREIVETNGVMISDPEDMSFEILFDDLTDIERVVLSSFNIVPKPQGVRFEGFIEEGAISTFGRSQFGSSQFAYKFKAGA